MPTTPSWYSIRVEIPVPSAPTGDRTVRLRVPFATNDEERVRLLIAQALSSMRLTFLLPNRIH